MTVKPGWLLLGLVVLAVIASLAPRLSAQALQSPVSPPYTPLPFRPTPHLLVVSPTPTERPTPGPEPWPAATATPVVLDAPMARLCPAVTPAPVRVLRWLWRAE